MDKNWLEKVKEILKETRKDTNTFPPLLDYDSDFFPFFLDIATQYASEFYLLLPRIFQVVDITSHAKLQINIISLFVLMHIGMF